MKGNVCGNISSLGGRRAPQTYGQRILFTGPDGIGDYRVKPVDFPRYIGVGPISPHETGDLGYLCRAAPGAPPPRPKHCYVGGVGWGLQYSAALNRTMHSNMHFKQTEFRSALEERSTHTHHNPWQPPPRILDQLPPGARGRLAWNHDVYGHYYQENYKQALHNRNQMVQKSPAGVSQLNSTNPPGIIRHHFRR